MLAHFTAARVAPGRDRVEFTAMNEHFTTVN